ncbi:FHA domain-containing protein [Cellulomonas sp. JH27-2]|uniref:FHA domain-containing protein n=1 Tax=Cellulomonas sp. JH27-2 TaxID=2774139 RepID=UPI001787756C|nr:FHA domain-containing protein [Cellulomonas sp. JH27-2]
MSVPAYVPGTWTAVACPGFVALLDPSVPAATVRAVWERGAEGVLGALAVLAREGFEGLPSFALVAVRGQRVHIVQRGTVEVVVSSAVGARTLTADGVTTWTEQVLEPATAVSLRVVDDADADATAWPLGDGAAAATSVEVTLVDVAQIDETDAPDETDAAEASVPTSALPAVAAVPTVVADETAPADDTVPADGTVPADDTEPVDEPADEPADAPGDESADETVETTQAYSPEDRPDADLQTDADDDEPVPALVPLESTSPSGGAVAQRTPAPRTEPVPMISPLAAVPDSVPTPVVAPSPVSAPTPVTPSAPAVTTTTTGTSPTSLPALVAVGAASADDHDGLTILSTDLAAIRERLPSWAADWTGAEAVPGPFGAPASSQVPQLVLSTGLVVPLDRAVLLGRAPQVTRVANSELPHLVTVPSPQQDISRTHAEVRYENGKVTVTDLASTNGVHLTRKGEGARRLHPGEATVVEPGHVVDLGDGVTFTVEHGS